ncbi:MAG TPA: hypothetical protein VE999_07860 [Gemmataceae bacterium]|nr:hypothetical protein [Gemmataceae bacterium]
MSTESEPLAAPLPSSRQVQIAEVDGDLELSYRQRSWPVVCFLILWLTGWTGGCIMLIRQLIADPSVRNILFAVPFFASWIFVFGVILWMLSGVERVRLNAEGLDYQLIAVVTLARRLVPSTELKRVCAGMGPRHAQNSSKSGEKLPCLRFETQGLPIEFACGISEKEQRWLVEWLNQYLDICWRHDPLERKRSPHKEAGLKAGKRILQAVATPEEPPSDSRIDMRPDRDAMEFVWRGRWNPAAIAGMTFINLFWNGILAVFIYAQIEDFNWFLFFLLIPHEIVGMCLIAMWLATLTAPLWRLTWTFDERGAASRLSLSDEDAVVFNLGWSKRFDVQPPVRIELRRPEGEKPSGSLWELLSHPDGDYSLVFIGIEEKEFLRIDRLTEGDACWIADVLLHAFPSWSGAAKAAMGSVE